ncbi:MAG: cytochrome C oxidase subunit IV family protein [Longimicrobiales bacterium]|nr:cytochrome C oxidase subunit IV family protein [Longimicrobiales bacterium]
MSEDAMSEDAHKHPPYMLVWGILFALTVGEVFYAFLELPKLWLAFGLILMALWKAALVALYYMHLRFEPRRLWVLAASPLPLAVILVVVVIMEF